MIDRKSEYRINNSTFVIQYGDITNIQADVIVSSDDNYISMGGGVSAAIRRVAGSTIVEETRKQIPIKIGDVAVTSAGKLNAKFVFHAITIDFDNWQYANAEIIKSATIRCLQLADILKIKHIAFPALATGVAGVPFEITARTMTETIGQHLLGETQIEKVTITLFAREHVTNTNLDFFYEHSVGIVAILCQSSNLDVLLSNMQLLFKGLGRRDLLGDIENLQTKINATKTMVQPIEIKEPIISEQKEKDIFEPKQSENNLNELSKDIHKFTNKNIEEFNDKQLESEVLRTKISGLYTTLNIKTAQLNKFEIEKAKYGGILTPPRLETAIEEMSDEINTIEDKIQELRKRMVALNNPFV